MSVGSLTKNRVEFRIRTLLAAVKSGYSFCEYKGFSVAHYLVSYSGGVLLIVLRRMNCPFIMNFYRVS